MSAYGILAKRAVGELPVSIGTSLAVEALKKNDSGDPKKPIRYGSLWINLRTLYRNIYESVETIDKPQLTAAAIADAMQEELGYILEYGAGKIDRIQLYHREYGDLLQRFPGSILRVPNTPLQKQYAAMMNQTIDEVLSRDREGIIDVSKGSQLRGEPTNALIITHYPIDLLSRTAFTKLRLLESYTGAIKSKSNWGSKLTDGKLHPRLPFNDFTIQVFGDGPVLFMRYPKAVRESVLALADKFNWTSVTTLDKVRQNLKWMNDRYTSEILQRMI